MSVHGDPRRAAPLRRGHHVLDVAVAFATVLLVFAGDSLAGSEFDAAVIYAFPVGWAAWRVSRNAGLWIAVSGAVADTLADLQIGRYPRSVLPIAWNLATQLTLLFLVAWVIGLVRTSLARERSLLVQLGDTHRRLDDEVRRVADVQRDLLPPSVPEVPGYEIAVRYVPSVRASGDYYDFFPLDGGRLGLLVADASGHGPSAAVIMAMMRALVHAGAPSHAHPETLLQEAGRQLAENLMHLQFVTACYAILDPGSGTLEYALAGHPLPILCAAEPSAAREIGVPQGPPLGLEPGARYDRQTARLGPGDALVLYTDGLTEARRAGGEPIGEDPVLRRIESRAAGGSAALADALGDLLAAHSGGASLLDDVTFVVVCRSPG